MMELTQYRETMTNDIVIILRVSDIDFLKTKFYEHDYLLFRECEKSNLISDKLLALGTLTSRIEAGGEARNGRV